MASSRRGVRARAFGRADRARAVRARRCGPSRDTQSAARLRALPSRVGVYFLLAMCLFPEIGYQLVWQKLTASLTALPVVMPTAKALRDLRRRVGSAPMRRLFEVLSGPLAQPSTPGVRFGPYRTVSFDGCSSLKAPDTARNRAWLGSPSRGGYPQLELMALVETGTRALIGAVFGPTSEGERRLCPAPAAPADAGHARVMGQRLRQQCLSHPGQCHRRTSPGPAAQQPAHPVLTVLADGSYLSTIGTLQIRIVEARITVTCADGTTFTGSYRLVTTLTDAARYPAAALVRLYHQRWEHESAYYALRHTIMQGRVLRSGDPAGCEQEMWSVLTLYQLLRTVMVDAAESRPGTDPDRCGFSIALHTARDLVVQAAGITACGITLVGTIGRRLLANLLPPRRLRVSTRKVTSPISRYNDRLDDGRPDRSRPVTALSIAILAAPPSQAPLPAVSRDDRLAALTDRRRQRVLALLQQDPSRSWRQG
ncbi:transposase domain-containing protein [Streptosporangium lutulentum]